MLSAGLVDSLCFGSLEARTVQSHSPFVQPHNLFAWCSKVSSALKTFFAKWKFCLLPPNGVDALWNVLSCSVPWQFSLSGDLCLQLYMKDKRKKGVVAHHALARGHCIAFWLSIPSLQVAPRFACSVASLSRSPGH